LLFVCGAASRSRLVLIRVTHAHSGSAKRYDVIRFDAPSNPWSTVEPKPYIRLPLRRSSQAIGIIAAAAGALSLLLLLLPDSW
jgi:hypothetical protein